MKFTDHLEDYCEWEIPSLKLSGLFGTIKIDETSNILTLVCKKSYSKLFHHYDNISYIKGKSVNKYTLIQCTVIYINERTDEDNYIVHIKFERLLTNVYLDKLNDYSLKIITAKFKGLGYFLSYNNNDFKVKSKSFKNKRRYSLDLKPIQYKYKIQDNLYLILKVSFLHSQDLITGLKAGPLYSIDIESTNSEGILIEKALNILELTRVFLSILCCSVFSYISISVIENTKPIRYLSNINHWFRVHNEEYVDTRLFPFYFKEIKNEFGDLLVNFLNFFEKNPIPVNIIFDLISSPKSQVIDNLSVLRGLESLDRVFEDSKIYKNDEHLFLINHINSIIPTSFLREVNILNDINKDNDLKKELLELLKMRLTHFNEPSLRNRLNRLLNNIINEELEENINNHWGKRKNFISQCVELRNTSAHGIFKANNNEKDPILYHMYLKALLAANIIHHCKAPSYISQGIANFYSKFATP